MLLSACALKPADQIRIKPARFEDLPGWTLDDHLAAYKSYARSCGVLKKTPGAKPVGGGEVVMLAQDLAQPCWAATARPIHTSDQARQFFEDYFWPYLAANRGNATGLFTGYYQPVLNGSLKKTKRFKYPLYAMPKSGVAQPRSKIEAGALKKKKLEIAWVDDAVDLFFLQIQGSGLIRMPDGSLTGVAYAGQNGFAYVPIGRLLKERGELPQDNINMSSIKAWLRANPDRAQALMNENPSYVFFKLTPPGEPIGAQGVPLTPERSLAVDSSFVPLGTPVYMQTILPDGRPFQQLVIAQDRGGAIKGPVRGDIFFGQGERAEYLAGYMKGSGRYYLLLPKQLFHGEK